jgi:hypothetical protein
VQIVREPLLHFFLFGCLLFLFYSWSSDDQWSVAEDIVVDQRRIDALSTQYELVWQHPPTTDELRTLTMNWVREEVLYREGLARGLDRNDPVVRRRIVQNMEFLIGASVPRTPSEEELQAWLQANAEKYLTPTQYRFRQVYFDPERGAEDLSEKVTAVREQLISGEKPLAADPTLLPHAQTDTTLPEVAGVFGKKFAAALEELAPGDWAGPVESEYGFHLVLVERITPGHIPGLHNIRSTVENDYLYHKTKRARDEFYHALRSRRSIKIEAGPVATVDL